MAQAPTNQLASSPIFRFESPVTLDVGAIESAAAKPQRGAWRYLAGLFEQAQKLHSHQFSIEPDATVWRVRYRQADGFEEHVLSDPTEMIWALEALQIQLWDENFHTLTNRTTRFTWANKTLKQAVSLSVVQTVNGDLLQFDTEPMLPMPPLLDELFIPEQLADLRNRLLAKRGMVLLTSTDPHLLDDTLLAINQDLVSPERRLLSINERHRYNVPRTSQVGLSELPEAQINETWESALDSFHDAVFINAPVPPEFHERLADACDKGTLAITAMRVANAADAIDMLNASVIRRAPLYRSVNTVVNHFRIKRLCQACACTAKLNEEEHQWLEQSRTPVTQNVIGWLVDGNVEQYLSANGCDACDGTGENSPLSVYDIIHRDEKNYLFPMGASTPKAIQAKTLQRQLMSLAKAGEVSLSEVIRVLKLAGY